MTDYINLDHTGDSGGGGVLSMQHVCVTNVKVKGVFGNMETLGLVSVKHDHCQHVDHGWVHRYVLLINGIVLAEKMVKSDRHKKFGGAILDGAAEIGRVRKTVHKSVWNKGYKTPEITGGEGHETS